MKETLISTDLTFKIIGQTEATRFNLLILVNRMLTELEVVKSPINSSKMIRNLDDIIKSFGEMEKYIEQLKKSSDEAREFHNKLYGDKDKI